MKQFNKLSEFCSLNNIIYDENMENKFSMFFELLVEKNKVMNLTAITEKIEVEVKHYIDSLESVPVIRSLTKQMPFSVIDIGTGAGFPGIPLSIVLPEGQFTLMDSLNKRIDFINDAVNQLELQNVKAIHSRAEDAGKSDLRETFDFCVSRAVANMSVLLEYMLPMVKTDGHCILYKSGEYKEELDEAAYALDLLGGELSEIKTFVLPDTDMDRSLIIIKKVKETPEKYPRKAGKPLKSPLIRK